MRKLRKSLVGVAAVAAIAATVLTGCSGRGGAPAESSETADIVVRGSWPLSGPLAAAGLSAAGAQAYFDKVNDEGGIDGRQIDFAALDDAYDPARVVSNNKEFVQKDDAMIVVNFGGIAVPARPAINAAKVAQVVQAGQSPLSDIEEYPYSRAFWPDVSWEGELQGRYLTENLPDAKVGFVGFNNDLTDSQVAGLEAGGVTLTKVITMPPGQADVSSQVTELEAAGVDVLIVTTGAPTMGALLSYMGQVGYRPTVFVGSTAADFSTTVTPAGAANVEGAYSFMWKNEPQNPAIADSEALAEYHETMAKYAPDADAEHTFTFDGYGLAAAIVSALESADEISTDGFLAAWDDMSDVKNPLLIDGATLNGGPGGRVVYQYQLHQFDGEAWVPVGDIENVAEDGIAK
jgi:ABC-type branched-subunit amino acid transport system substrate-binding protein